MGGYWGFSTARPLTRERACSSQCTSLDPRFVSLAGPGEQDENTEEKSAREKSDEPTAVTSQVIPQAGTTTYQSQRQQKGACGLERVVEVFHVILRTEPR